MGKSRKSKRRNRNKVKVISTYPTVDLVSNEDSDIACVPNEKPLTTSPASVSSWETDADEELAYELFCAQRINSLKDKVAKRVSDNGSPLKISENVANDPDDLMEEVFDLLGLNDSNSSGDEKETNVPSSKRKVAIDKANAFLKDIQNYDCDSFSLHLFPNDQIVEEEVFKTVDSENESQILENCLDEQYSISQEISEILNDSVEYSGTALHLVENQANDAKQQIDSSNEQFKISNTCDERSFCSDNNKDEMQQNVVTFTDVFSIVAEVKYLYDLWEDLISPFPFHHQLWKYLDSKWMTLKDLGKLHKHVNLSKERNYETINPLEIATDFQHKNIEADSATLFKTSSLTVSEMHRNKPNLESEKEFKLGNNFERGEMADKSEQQIVKVAQHQINGASVNPIQSENQNDASLTTTGVSKSDCSEQTVETCTTASSDDYDSNKEIKKAEPETCRDVSASPAGLKYSSSQCVQSIKNEDQSLKRATLVLRYHKWKFELNSQIQKAFTQMYRTADAISRCILQSPFGTFNEEILFYQQKTHFLKQYFEELRLDLFSLFEEVFCPKNCSGIYRDNDCVNIQITLLDKRAKIIVHFGYLLMQYNDILTNLKNEVALEVKGRN